MKNFNTILAVGAVAAVCGAAEAGVVYWSMGTAGSTSNNFGLTAGSVVAGNIVQGNNNGVTTMLGSTSPSANATSGIPAYTFDLNGVTTNASGGNNAGAAARTGAINTGTSGTAYFEFTLTTAADYSAFVTQISLGSRSTSTGPKTLVVRSSIDGFASNLASVSVLSDGNWAYKTLSFASQLDLAAGSTTTFRIYGADGTGSATVNTANWRIDDLVVVPAPGAMALLGVAGLLGARRRR